MADRERKRLIFAHQEWLGFVQPVGLVVAPNVMVDAQVIPDRNVSERQRSFRALFEQGEGKRTVFERAEGTPNLSSAEPYEPLLRRVFKDWLRWEDNDLVDADAHRDSLEIPLPELHTVLAPTWAVPADEVESTKWSMLVRVEDSNSDLNQSPDDGAGWNASRHARFERLLRETGVPTGLLCTEKQIRLIHAPQGESSGHITFDFEQMLLPAGRPILAAFEMLLSADSLFGGDPDARLPTLLSKSRDAQAEVSTKLSRQVLRALHELLRGFVAAEARGTGSVTELANRDPDQLYGGLVTTLMRLVFVLYAEDRGLMPDHSVYQQHYSLGGLFNRLRTDAATWPDTMDQRFGAWAQLLALFGLIHGGGGHGDISFVARKGALFDPERFPFLEGREADFEQTIPMVPDATIWKILQSLMVLDGERLSYRTLDVEQIGSVYEAIMGFRAELTNGRSIAIASPKRTGAAVIINIDTLLELDGGERSKSLQKLTDRKLTAAVATALREASKIEDVIAALDRVIDRGATPDVVPNGTPVLQPTDERRRSGSHYTPRSLTEPIVSEALRPIFERLGADAKPEDILELKVVDPATGSGAFLVEACRQISERLVDAWERHKRPPELSDDEDELIHARRLVAQRCLYGVDRNSMAIDLARLSLWLVTLARDHEFTFIDHALRHGDSLVGFTRKQIGDFHWDAEASKFQLEIEPLQVRQYVAKVSELRQLIHELGNEAPEHKLRELLDEADLELRRVRRIGDLLLTAFFEETSPRERESRRLEYLTLLLEEGQGDDVSKNVSTPPVMAFHWEFEFPEVFERENPGFDVVIGNPPFAGKNTIAASNPPAYTDWLKQLHMESHGNSDLVAHFFRRTFNLLRGDGTLGLIATNTIGQGDTRFTGLRWICHHGGEIYHVQRRLKWPGDAAVVVSVIHIMNGSFSDPRSLDGRVTDGITAFLFHDGGHDDPERLDANTERSFVGSYILGMGFTFDDTDTKGVATPLTEMRRLLKENPDNKKVIFPYIGGEEINTSPTHSHHRHVINFRDWPLRRFDLGETWRDADDKMRRFWKRDGIVPLDYPEPVAADWPELLNVVEKSVKPARAHLTTTSIGRKRAKSWWRYGSSAIELYENVVDLDRVLAISRISQQVAFTFLPNEMVYAESMIVFPFNTHAAFCMLQSRIHEIWVRFFSSSLEDRLRYTPSDCFETFPFPSDWERNLVLEETGVAYYNFRATLMTQNDEGMTKTYNRFHDPDERGQDVVKLRLLHASMDRAVLDTYGWNDIPTDCEFLLDYELDEEPRKGGRKPWRYRWPDSVHDEVLARLLALNARMAQEEHERNA